MTVEFIAEIGSNHNQSFNRTMELIVTAKDIGCDAVKFQLFDVTQLYRYKEDQEANKKNELPIDFIPLIYKKCRDLDINFGCTPFGYDAVEVLKRYVDFFKISSYELLRTKFIEHVIKTKKDLILSSGMLLEKDIACLDYLVKRQTKLYGNKHSLLHCVADYPCYPADCNLSLINKYKRNYSFHKVGWSDHSKHPLVICEAAAQGANIIEFHLDLEDGQGNEYKHMHCWKPKEMRDVINNVRVMDVARGDGMKRLSETEKENLCNRADSVDGKRPIFSIHPWK